MKPRDALKKAITVVGTQEALAQKLNKRHPKRKTPVTQKHVSYWLNNRLPSHWVLDIERITGVSRHELRPDLYPKDRSRSNAA